MLNKFNDWWNDHVHTIATFGVTAWICTTIIMVLVFTAWLGTLGVMHDMEVQLAAHGVEWALYTPIP